jgi:hypothetical protein
LSGKFDAERNLRLVGGLSRGGFAELFDAEQLLVRLLNIGAVGQIARVTATAAARGSFGAGASNRRRQVSMEDTRTSTRDAPSMVEPI